jgi:hypothetical protein
MLILFKIATATLQPDSITSRPHPDGLDFRLPIYGTDLYITQLNN